MDVVPISAKRIEQFRPLYLCGIKYAVISRSIDHLQNNKVEGIRAMLANSPPKPTVRKLALRLRCIVLMLLAALIKPTSRRATDLANICFPGGSMANRVDAAQVDRSVCFLSESMLTNHVDYR